jgi:hypothetical protein
MLKNAFVRRAYEVSPNFAPRFAFTALQREEPPNK